LVCVFEQIVRIAVDWLLVADIGEVLKKDRRYEKFPDYHIPKKTRGRKIGRRKRRTGNAE
jgi:hypothetical protein